jgi:hypothetical protein
MVKTLDSSKNGNAMRMAICFTGFTVSTPFMDEATNYYVSEIKSLINGQVWQVRARLL